MSDCGDCGAKPGDHHKDGCDVERCARCGGQTISCGCIYDVCGMDRESLEDEHPDVFHNGPTDEMYAKWEAEWGARRTRWTGEWPGAAECREYGFWCIENPGGSPYWKPVPAGTPGASEDLNRLARECSWDQTQQRMVRRS